MKRLCAMLLMAALLLPVAATAEAPLPTPKVMNDARREAYALLDEAPYATSAEEAVSLILRAADASGDDPELVADCARMLYNIDTTGLYAKECEALLRKAVDLAEGETRNDLIQLLAEQLIMLGKNDEALALVDDAIEADADSEALKIARASAMYYEGNGALALDMLRDLLEDSPRNFEARKLLGAILLDEYQWEEALQIFRQIEEQWPEYLDGIYGQYLTYIASGQFDKGVRLVDTLLQMGADESLWLERARIRLWVQYRPEEALTELDALLRMDPEWVDAISMKVSALSLLERYDEAAETADTLRTIDAAQAELMYAAIEMDMGEWASAGKRLEALVGQAPLYASGWRNLAAVRLSGDDNVDGAKRAISKAFMVSGEYPTHDLYMQLGSIYAREGSMAEAARAYSAANALVWDDPGSLQQLMLLYLDAGNGEGALDMLETLELAYPGWYETMIARVIYEETRGHDAEALAAFEALAEKFTFPAEGLADYHLLLSLAAGERPAEDAQSLMPATEDEGGWDTYAYALALTGALEDAQAALDICAAQVEKAEKDGMDAGPLRSMRLSLLSARLMLHVQQGDDEAACAAIDEAAALGWQIHSLALDERYDGLRASDAYQALLAAQPALHEPWDLTADPTIP